MDKLFLKIKGDDELGSEVDVENYRLMVNSAKGVGFLVACWFLKNAYAALQTRPVINRSELMRQLDRKEELRRERFRARYVADQRAMLAGQQLEGEALEIVNLEFLKSLGVTAERVFQVYQCVSKAIRCFHKRDIKGFYVQLNNIMMQFTGKNTFEYLSESTKVFKGLEVFITYLLKSICEDVDCKESDEWGWKPAQNEPVNIEVSTANDDMFRRKRFIRFDSEETMVQEDDWEGNADEQLTDGKIKGQKVKEALTNLNKSANDWISLMNSEFSKKLTLLTSLVICLPAVQSLGISPKLLGYEPKMMEGLKFKYENFSSISFTAMMLEHTSWVALKICDMFNVIYEHGIMAGIRSLFISRSDFTDFDSEYSWLKVNVKNFKCRNLVMDKDGNPAPFSLDTYRYRCLKALDKAVLIEKTLKHDVFALNRIRAQKFQILDFLSECGAAQRVNESRPFPYAIMLTGPPEVGKSTVAMACFDQMHLSDNLTHRFDIPYKPDNIYTRNPNDDFYSGFDSSKVGMLIDDVAQKTPELVKQLGGDDLADLIQVINTVPFLTNQAELQDKGKVPMMIRYFVGTTNTPDLSVKHVFNCPTAVYRRMAFIDVSVKAEYRKANSVALKEGIDADNMDVWEFKIYRFRPTASVEPLKEYWNGEKYVQTHEPKSFNIAQLMTFIKCDIDRHWTREETNDKRKERLLQSEVCEHGIRCMLCNQCKCTKVEEVGEAEEKIRIPFWHAEDILPEDDYSEGKLKQFVDHVVCYSMFVPIYLSLLVANVSLLVRDRPHTTTPILPLRVARYLINRLPNNVEIPWHLRVYVKMPAIYLNSSTKCSAHCAKLYFMHKYNSMWRPTFSWSDYFVNEVAQEWAFIVVVAFTSVFTLFRGFKHFWPKNEGEAEVTINKKIEPETAKIPTPTYDDLMHANYWYDRHGIGSFPLVGSTTKDEDLLDKVRMNTVLLSFRGEDRVIRVNGFVLRNNLVVTVYHCFTGGSLPDSLEVTYLQDSGKPVTVAMKYDQTCSYIDLARDLLFIRVDKMNMRKDMTQYFCDDPDVYIKCPGYHVYFGLDDECVHTNPASYVTYAPPGRTYKYKEATYSLDGCVVADVRDPTFSGMCGSPLVLQQGKQKMLFGIHCAGPTNKEVRKSYVRQVSRQLIYDVIEHLWVIPVSKNDTSLAKQRGNACELTPVHPKCPTHLLKHKELIVLGGSKLPRTKPRTHVAPSPIVDDVIKEFTPDGYTEVLHTSPIDCDPKAAIMLSMEKAVENAQFYPSEIQQVVDDMSQEYLSHISPEMLKEIYPYPMSVAINGVDGIPYLERLNLSTSGGYGHPGPKKKLFVLKEPTEQHTVNYGMTPELEEEVSWIMEQYRAGLEANPVFKCSFKDEPITFEKAKMSKVRIFSGSPVAFSLVVRMYFMCLIRIFVGKDRLNFEMAIGANAHGKDWQDIYERVIKFGKDRVFAGDYKNFDKQMPPEVIMAAFKIMVNIFKAASWSEEDLQVVYGIAVDTAYPTMDLFGTLIRCFGSNPSGHVLTTIVNSIVNGIYIRLACRRILLYHGMNVDLSRFSDIVSLVTYGDDNCGSVSPEYPMITHASIQEALAEAGIIYTTDDKKSLSVGLTNVDNITFLKRRFVYHDDLSRMGAPLLEDSLFKSLTVWTWSKVICDREQLASVLESANREYFFYGREKFERRHRFFKEMALKYGCVEYLPNGLLSYDKILQELSG